jgi:tetratricopeptide (TPR) repeat protein
MKTGRNDPCPCGSGKKYKKCCEQKDLTERTSPSPQGHGGQTMLQSALGFHQAGELSMAEDLYRKVLAKDPNNADALHLLGLICHQHANYVDAESLLREAIKNDPNAAFFYINLGNTLKACGKSEDAIVQYRNAIRIDPSIAEAHYNLANELQELKEFEDAIQSYRTAVRLNPGLADAYFNMGKALKELESTEEAIISIKKAIELRPDYAEAYYALGVMADDSHRLEDALGLFRKAFELKPDYADACFNIADALRELERPEESELYFRRVIEMKPGYADAYNSLSVALRQQGKIKEAVEAALKAIDIKPDYISAYNNLGLHYREDGQAEKAIEAFREAISMAPGFADAEWNLGMAYLQRGDLPNGWKQYEWRFLNTTAVVRQFPIPRWDGSSPEGKTILVCAEQGIGDQVMFASIIKDLMATGPQLILECDARLRPLFCRSFSDAEVISVVERPEDFHSYEGCRIDFRIPSGSLAGFLRPGLQAFSVRGPYLKADESRIQYWRARFNNLGSGLKVGVSWRGGAEQSVRMMRSIPLAQWAQITAVEGCQFINLQYGDVSEEIRRAGEEHGVTVHSFSESDPLKDLDEFAAQISALDLVVSVDNSTVHIAGSLGVPTIALLPRGCDWRWMNEVEDTPWYESVRLLRQKEHRFWDDVFDRLESILRKYVSKGVVSLEIPSNSYCSIDVQEQQPAVSIGGIRRSVPKKTYKCAVVTPVGPGHKIVYEECLDSIERAFAGGRGSFSEVLPVMVDDSLGQLGRSKARNIGVGRAAELGADWIFFLDADDIMVAQVFEYVSSYIENYDAVWGSIWSNEKDRDEVLERPGQLPFLLGMDDITACDPYNTLQMGHFVRTDAALKEPFSEVLNTGEDFDYYLRVWERYRCLKIPLPFFHNIRGRSSEGPRSATSDEWRKAVIEMLNRHRRKKIRIILK